MKHRPGRLAASMYRVPSDEIPCLSAAQHQVGYSPYELQVRTFDFIPSLILPYNIPSLSIFRLVLPFSLFFLLFFLFLPIAVLFSTFLRTLIPMGFSYFSPLILERRRVGSP